MAGIMALACRYFSPVGLLLGSCRNRSYPDYHGRYIASLSKPFHSPYLGMQPQREQGQNRLLLVDGVQRAWLGWVGAASLGAPV
jgi:hypothetical protein